MVFPRWFSSARASGQSGFTRVELLVLGFVLIIFAVSVVGPLGWQIEQARIGRAVDSAHTLNTLLSQFATDNDGVYPTGEGTSQPGKSEGIAQNLLANNYTPDAAIFALGSAPKYSGKDPAFHDLGADNVSWDFTAGATSTTGVTAAAPDQLPMVYSTGETVTYPTTPGTGLDLTLSGNGPFGMEGIVVAYKGGNADFNPGTITGTSAIAQKFISPDFKDAGTYTQIKP